MGADGANDVVSGGPDVLGLLDEVTQGVAGPVGTLFKESERVGMSVDRITGDIEFKGEVGGTLPMEETLLDGLASGVAADGAAYAVIGEIWLGLAAFFIWHGGPGLSQVASFLCAHSVEAEIIFITIKVCISQ